MNISAPFIARPVATTLLTLGVVLAGLMGYRLLPVAPLPQVELPTIQVTASMPGASPETMASAVATPLERHLGHIANVTEMTSSSSVGNTRITLQFGLDRSINGAARDVQAAINAARADLPANLRSNPTYRKLNPASAPIMILSLVSATMSPGQLYDSAATVLQQKLSQVEGIGQVNVSGSALPAVRVEINPHALFKYQIGLEDVRAALSAANANAPKGAIEEGDRRFQIYTNDQARRADQYRNLVIAYRNGAVVRVSDIAEVVDSVEDLRNAGIANGVPSVLVILYGQPGANIIDTVDRVTALLPELAASIPSDIDLAVAIERTTTIRASIHEVERTLLIAIALVILVVFLFLRNLRATIIPVVAVPVSLIATFGVMYLCGYSINNLSLMALTVATGFVVDDAIVVLENVSRHLENGMSRVQAALLGAREVGFTVLSMSISLVAVFIPILLMGGIVGRFFREFAVVLSAAVLVSLVVSLTTTPMMCARLLRPPAEGATPARWARWSEAGFEWLRGVYERSLGWALRHGVLMMLLLLATIGLNVYLYIVIPKGLFPQQDTGRLVGGIQADQSISFQAMRQKLVQFITLVKQDPAVETVVGFTGGARTNSGFVFVALKPLRERDASADRITARLRTRLANVPGATLFFSPVQDIRVGGRAANATYQYTVQGDDLAEVRTWVPKIAEALKEVPQLVDVNSDLEEKGIQTDLVIDRDAASRLGVTTAQIDNTLYDAFGQRQVSTIYNPLNQYHVVMELAPRYWQNPEILDEIFVSTAGAVSGTQSTNAVAGTTAAKPTARSGARAAPAPTATANAATIASDAARNQATNRIANTTRSGVSTGVAVSTRPETMVPLSTFATYAPSTTPLAVNHQGHFVAATISFNLPPDGTLGSAVNAIHDTMNRIGVPVTVQGTFQGTARVFQQSLDNQPILILTALLAVYIVLGILYESYIHPITILSTLPSAGIGALLALKNAIMMIDFALDAQRNRGLDPRSAIHQACLQRFRPIMMTTMAAMLGAVPLAIGFSDGSELRRPLGISIVGGLIVSQMLTLYTTPVIYLYLDRFGSWVRRQWHRAPLLEGA
ncbi:MAG: efflux RND transporter permease subunit [Proteobacteria bacterium]|nr:efflux RND transporter permease subunit [Pseudomonadota bacterium]